MRQPLSDVEPAPAVARTTMRALVQDRFGSAEVLRIREIDRPAAGAGRVLVRVRAASINAVDYHLMHPPLPVRLAMGRRRPKRPVIGVDLAGVVEAVGTGVTRFSTGDEVFGTALGACAEYASTEEARLERKPRGLTFEQAAAVPVAGVTALQGLRDKARLQPGQRVLIYGAGGGVGSFAVQIAKALGAHVTAATSTANMDLVRSLGPDEVVDYTQEDLTRKGARYDVFFDIAANRSLRACRRALAPEGTFVLVGAAKGGTVAIVTRLISVLALARFARQRMVTFIAKVRREDLATLAELIEAGKLSPAIDRVYPLGEAAEAMRYAESGRARAKVVISVSSAEPSRL
jgi:NADPH:quinone reductase-like Zn-dependent oxidoreductase